MTGKMLQGGEIMMIFKILYKMTIFKQYGEQRSGTNYINRLLESNFKNIIVFSSILGWKHGMYELNSGYSSAAANDHYDWIDKKEKNNKIYSVDNYELVYTKDFLYNSVHNLNYIISYKPIIPWIYSYKKFRHSKARWSEVDINLLCNRYINNIRRWISLPNYILINHNQLLTEDGIIKILDEFKDKYNLDKKQKTYYIEKKIVNPSTDLGLLISVEDFDPSWYIDNHYIKYIPGDILKLCNTYSKCVETLLA
jgi:hypothetical protein